MRPELYIGKVRRNRTASYLDINPEPPPRSSRDRGWEGIIVEREHFLPFDNGEVVYDEHFIGIVEDPNVRMRHQSDDGAYDGVYRPGDIVISPAAHPVRWTLHDESDASLLVVLPSFLQEIALEATDVDPAKVRLVSHPRTHDPLIAQTLSLLLAELETGGVGERLYAESIANILAVHLLRHYSTLVRKPKTPPKGGLPASKLRRAVDAIRGRLKDGVSLSEVARAAGVSSSHFATLFKRSTGLSPHQYLIQCRVERAWELLRYGKPDLTLAQIALETGFCDQSHLTRHFKRLVGVTPAEFRRIS